MDDSAQRTVADYYQRRAGEYDRIYFKPAHQADFAHLRSWLVENVTGKTVLEVACGTGHWTAVAAPSARSIVATDINAAPLDIARQRGLGPHVHFEMGDAYQLEGIHIAFDCGLAAFWCSHVPRSELAAFLQSFAHRLRRNGALLLIDSKWVDGHRQPLLRREGEEDTYQRRQLEDGSTFEVLKNFLTKADVESACRPFAVELEWRELDYLWAARVVVRPRGFQELL